VLLLLLAPSPGRSGDRPLRDGLPLERCAEPAGKPIAGVELGYLCQLSDRGPLGGPLDEFAPAIRRLRAGVLAWAYPFHNLHYARSTLGEQRFAELLAIYEQGRVLSSLSEPSWSEPRILAVCAAGHVDAGERARCAEAREQLLADLIEAHGAELIAARRDRDRFEFLDLDRPVPAAADWLDPLSVGYAGSFTSFDPSTLPTQSPFSGVEGNLVVPLFVGPDGIGHTADDLPLPIEASPRLSRRAPYPRSTWDEDFEGDPVFDSIATVSGTVDERGGLSVSNQPLVLYGVLGKPGLERLGCSALGGRAEGVGCIDAQQRPIERATLLRAGCAARSEEGTRGGFNLVGECVVLNTKRGSARFETNGVSLTVGAHADLVKLLADPSLRPPSAALEPSDLTDFLDRALAQRPIPTRPPFPFDVPPAPPARPSRATDPATGAPVRRDGPPQCVYRTAEGGSSVFRALSVGPDGTAGTADDAIASEGRCLLFDPPSGPGEPQPVRPARRILEDHPAHQELFRRLCAAAFDDDDGHCGLDALNQLRVGPEWELILNGSLLVNSPATLAGIESIRVRGQSPASGSWHPSLKLALEPLLHPLRSDLNPLDLLPLTPAEGALLGCGPSFVRACGLRDENRLSTDESVVRALGVRSLHQVPRGPDLEYAEASVLFQESPLEKALSAGALVGARADGLGFEAGIQSGGLRPEEVRALSEPERAGHVRGGVPTDAWVEPLPWALDPDALERGIVLYRVANALEPDPRCDPEREGRPRDLLGEPLFSPGETAYCTARRPAWAVDPSVLVLNDPTDPGHPENQLVAEGENCSDSIAGFAPSSTLAGTLFQEGCTALEYLSSNFWRAQMGFEIVGRDRAFDPPETAQELAAMLDGDPENDLTGDPVAGPDGIFVKNARVFSADEADVHALLFPVESPSLLPLPELDTDGDGDPDLSMQDFFDRLVPSDCPASVCRLRIGTARFVAGHDGGKPATRPIASALPVAMRMRLVSVNGTAPPPELELPHVNVLEVYETDRRAFAELFEERPARIRRVRARDPSGEVVELRGDLVVDYDPSLDVHPTFVGNVDLDPLGIQDLDQDGDGIYDGLDDGSPGPISDDGVLCGPGVPGDFLQEAVQFEAHSRAEEEAFDERFPGGIPPRSPVFCARLLRWHGFTVRDSGDVRRFRWHHAEARLDLDQDGVLDPVDNCTGLANPDQADRGGLAEAVPDGIGDACQCGDVSDNGRVTATDAALVHRALLRIPPFGEGIASLHAPERCDVDRDQDCSAADALHITRALLGLVEPLGACGAAPPGVPEPSSPSP
jgi:hypothetical protein